MPCLQVDTIILNPVHTGSQMRLQPPLSVHPSKKLVAPSKMRPPLIVRVRWRHCKVLSGSPAKCVGRRSVKLLTVSHICSFICFPSMLIIRAPNSTPEQEKDRHHHYLNVIHVICAQCILTHVHPQGKHFGKQRLPQNFRGKVL